MIMIPAFALTLPFPLESGVIIPRVIALIVSVRDTVVVIIIQVESSTAGSTGLVVVTTMAPCASSRSQISVTRVIGAEVRLRMTIVAGSVCFHADG
jgi:hypothetical protein